VQGFLWIAAIWSLTLYGLYRFVVVRSGRWPLSPILVQSLFLLLLGIESTGAPSTGNSIGLNTVIRGFLASAALVFALRALLVNASRGRVRRGTRRTNLMLLSAYAGFAAFSTMYSASPLQTAGKAYEMVVGMIVVWAIATSADARNQMRAAIDMIVILWAAILVVAIPGFFLVPSHFVLQEEGRPGFIFTETMAAPYAHSNGLSAIGAMVAAYALARGFRETTPLARRLWFALGIVSSGGILLASGRQGVVIWAVSVGIVLFMLARPLCVFIVIPATAFATQHWSMQLWSALTRDQQETTLYTLSGRLSFWNAAIEVWKQSPLIGYGFGSGGRFVALPSIGQGFIGSLHSGYFEALVGVGLIGVMPLLIVVVRVVRWSWLRLLRGVEPHLSILIVPLAMHTAISLGFGAWLSSQFLVLALIASCADLEPELGRSRRALLQRAAVGAADADGTSDATVLATNAAPAATTPSVTTRGVLLDGGSPLRPHAVAPQQALEPPR
jgi:O-antigen ligase